VHRLGLRQDAKLHAGADRVRDLLRRGRGGPVAASAARATRAARGRAQPRPRRVLEARADLRALRRLTVARTAAPPPRLRRLEREAAEHRGAAVALQTCDGFVDVFAHERGAVACGAPHAVVDLTARVGLVAFPGWVDAAPGHAFLHHDVLTREPLAVGH